MVPPLPFSENRALLRRLDVMGRGDGSTLLLLLAASADGPAAPAPSPPLKEVGDRTACSGRPILPRSSPPVEANTFVPEYVTRLPPSLPAAETWPPPPAVEEVGGKGRCCCCPEAGRYVMGGVVGFPV